MNETGLLTVDVNKNTRKIALIFDGYQRNDNDDECECEGSILGFEGLLLVLILQQREWQMMIRPVLLGVVIFKNQNYTRNSIFPFLVYDWTKGLFLKVPKNLTIDRDDLFLNGGESDLIIIKT
jgi:hypothetical protein